ncbi:hypothetical protein L1N85_11305 [Paenibacillus alkaliterrae]|uniref:hypothetical protein n=1 Tax=Paenibacillus alkaliterrae TaxID=320909 RepID=UPI001F35C377|nr:hypothetical protein [Paenibacillus alkaliterrae]MCF2939024.1 hypothetical protein [Paenibacillus alkaliterrae]
MPKYRVYGVVTATKYLGEFEADTKEEAEGMAWESGEAYVSVCHSCSGEVDGAEIDSLEVEEIDEQD